tara:strand:- start:73 stop:267 length:195 start_codon:yes stop_codon:yes gene_type:complete
MGNIADTSIFQEMQEEMEDWFEYMDNVIETELIHEVNGEVVTEPLEDVLEREQLEMEAELSVGI